MATQSLKVPTALLMDENLAATAKLLWMIHQLCSRGDQGPICTGQLEARSGLARNTVLRGMAQLQGADWLPVAPAGQQPGTLGVPADLLLDSRVELQGKLLYAILGLTPGQFAWSGLSQLTGASVTTLKKAIISLRGTGWLRISQKSRYAPIHFTLLDPVAERREQERCLAEQRLNNAKFKGEAIMREYLSLIADSDEYEDDATPGFLVNPFTGEEMQFDRYYPPTVAYEFNGAQHYIPTEFADQTDVRKQQGRDLLKRVISKDRGITLVVVHPEDLTLEGMRRKVDGILPLRKSEGHEPLIAFLQSVSRGYRRRSRKAD